MEMSWAVRGVLVHSKLTHISALTSRMLTQLRAGRKLGCA